MAAASKAWSTSPPKTTPPSSAQPPNSTSRATSPAPPVPAARTATTSTIWPARCARWANPTRMCSPSSSTWPSSTKRPRHADRPTDDGRPHTASRAESADLPSAPTQAMARTPMLMPRSTPASTRAASKQVELPLRRRLGARAQRRHHQWPAELRRVELAVADSALAHAQPLGGDLDALPYQLGPHALALHARGEIAVVVFASPHFTDPVHDALGALRKVRL